MRDDKDGMTASHLDDVDRDAKWAEQFEDEAAEILREHLFKNIGFIRSSHHEDAKECTDMVPYVTTDIGSVALRMRRATVKHRDFTIRAWRASGVKTEKAKILEGWGSCYLYGWTTGRQINEWILVNLDKIRESGLLLKNRQQISNKDGVTKFVTISIQELQDANAIEDSKLDNDNDIPATGTCAMCGKPADCMHYVGQVRCCIPCCMQDQAKIDEQRATEEGRQRQSNYQRWKEENKERLAALPKDKPIV
jgi:hypothetical protein